MARCSNSRGAFLRVRLGPPTLPLCSACFNALYQLRWLLMPLGVALGRRLAAMGRTATRVAATQTRMLLRPRERVPMAPSLLQTTLLTSGHHQVRAAALEGRRHVSRASCPPPADAHRPVSNSHLSRSRVAIFAALAPPASPAAPNNTAQDGRTLRFRPAFGEYPTTVYIPGKSLLGPYYPTKQRLVS